MPCRQLTRQSWQHVRSRAACPRAAHRRFRQDSAMQLCEVTCQLQCVAAAVLPRPISVCAKTDISSRGEPPRPGSQNGEFDGKRQQFVDSDPLKISASEI